MTYPLRHRADPEPKARTPRREPKPFRRPRIKLALGASFTVFALAALAALAPPPPLTAAQRLAAYDSLHAQKLTVSSAVVVQDVARDTYTATPAIQTFVNGGTNYDWASLVLLFGHWPITDSNKTVIVRWMRQENGVNNWWNRDNPLNNSFGAPGAGGTGRYTSLIMSAQKCAEALHKGVGGGYLGIVASLAASASPDATAQAIFASGWSSSHYANGTHWSTRPVEAVKAPASAW
ncbi:MAG TPA: hypothetical protein VGI56_14960 [Galbitalea sp.]